MGLADALESTEDQEGGATAPQEEPVASYAPPPQNTSYAPPPGPMSVQPPPSAMPYPGVSSGPAPGAAPPPVDPSQYIALARQGQGPARPAGFSPTSRTTEGTQYSPETVGAVGDSLAAQRELAGAQLGYDQQHGASQAAVDKHVEVYDQADQIQATLRRQQQQSQLADYHQHIEGLMADAEQAGKIDPNRYMANKSVGQRIGLAIAAALGGFGGALTHTGNPVLEMINKNISEDIEAQKAQAANSAQSVGRAVNLYQMNREKLGDDERATQATSLAMRQAYVSHLQGIAGQADAPAAMRLRAAQLAAPLQKDIAATLRDLDEKTVKQTTSEAYHQATVPGGDPLVTLRRAGEAKKLTEELTGTSQGQRKEEAEIGKTEAETAKTQATAHPEAKSLEQFEKAAKGVKSTSLWSDPEKALSQNVQNTEGNEAAMQREGLNSMVMGALIKSHPGIARNKELFDKAVNTYLINSNDTDTTIERKKALARQNLFNGAPSEGVSEGVSEDSSAP